ncbi:pyrimidine 5'-nucleotidase [Methylovorus glucosotrophus]|uniref:Pyrimidine 5'-nucleotidase n=1 Tax=Methylovorus glucosotrophus (strain SIP3-4) TaxID=582744 RepID=C6X9A2_METGS|nr:pyrimidine 5'-nucleotidase [Methylovorus glucosotrophus]ACT49722.1 pyrimidine 5'-nucleotidase [Methylovorus glucosotrophus SIP3-4]
MRPIWIFDLDDTLHDASAHIFPHLNRAMTQYIMDTLALGEAEAHALRQRYWRIYGATLKGLMRHHGTDPYHFLVRTHELMNLPDMVVHAKRLRHALLRLPGRKVVFTNAPMQYALRVLKLIGVEDMFEIVHSVESTRFHPKPSVRGFQSLLRTLRGRPGQCIMVEDNLPALRTARRLGMKTVHITRRLHKPCYVSARLNSVLALTRHTI